MSGEFLTENTVGEFLSGEFLSESFWPESFWLGEFLSAPQDRNRHVDASHVGHRVIFYFQPSFDFRNKNTLCLKNTILRHFSSITFYSPIHNKRDNKIDQDRPTIYLT